MFYTNVLARATEFYFAGTHEDPRNPLASPLYADLQGLPPLLIHVGAPGNPTRRLTLLAATPKKQSASRPENLPRRPPRLATYSNPSSRKQPNP